MSACCKLDTALSQPFTHHRLKLISRIDFVNIAVFSLFLGWNSFVLLSIWCLLNRKFEAGHEVRFSKEKFSRRTRKMTLASSRMSEVNRDEKRIEAVYRPGRPFRPASTLELNAHFNKRIAADLEWFCFSPHYPPQYLDGGHPGCRDELLTAAESRPHVPNIRYSNAAYIYVRLIG